MRADRQARQSHGHLRPGLLIRGLALVPVLVALGMGAARAQSLAWTGPPGGELPVVTETPDDPSWALPEVLPLGPGVRAAGEQDAEPASDFSADTEATADPADEEEEGRPLWLPVPPQRSVLSDATAPVPAAEEGAGQTDGVPADPPVFARIDDADLDGSAEDAGSTAAAEAAAVESPAEPEGQRSPVPPEAYTIASPQALLTGDLPLGPEARAAALRERAEAALRAAVGRWLPIPPRLPAPDVVITDPDNPARPTAAPVTTVSADDGSRPEPEALEAPETVTPGEAQVAADARPGPEQTAAAAADAASPEQTTEPPRRPRRTEEEVAALPTEGEFGAVVGRVMAGGRPARIGQTIPLDTEITTGDGARARLDLIDGTQVAVGEQARLQLSSRQMGVDQAPLITLDAGSVAVNSLSRRRAAQGRRRLPVILVSAFGEITFNDDAIGWAGPIEGRFGVVALTGRIIVTGQGETVQLTTVGMGTLILTPDLPPIPPERWNGSRVLRAVAQTAIDGDAAGIRGREAGPDGAEATAEVAPSPASGFTGRPGNNR